jgi:uncharacterized protein (DUF2237 family)
MPRLLPPSLVLSALLALGAVLQTGCTTSMTGTDEPNGHGPLLAGLVLSGATLTPPFDAARKTYTADCTQDTPSLTVRPLRPGDRTLLRVNGALLAGGSMSAPLHLRAGPNEIVIEVIAPNGPRSTYVVTAQVSQGTDSRLAGLACEPGEPSPAFDPAVTTCGATFGTETGSLTLTPTVADPRATVKVAGQPVASGHACAPIPLAVGPNAIPVVVTAEDGTTTTYTFQARVVLDANTLLAGLSTSRGTLSPPFDPALTDYTMAIHSGLPALRLAVAAASGRARLAVTANGVPLASGGNGLDPAALAIGVNTLRVRVTAENLEERTYTLRVTRYDTTLPVTVADTVGGAPVPGAVLQVLDPAGTLLEDGIQADADGRLRLGFDPARKYTVTVGGPGLAQTSFANLDPTLETSLALYGHPLGLIAAPAQAPTLLAISYSADGQAWIPVTDNRIRDAAARIRKLRITAVAPCGLGPTPWCAYGIGVQLGRRAWALDLLTPTSYDENSTPTLVDGLPCYQSTSEFDLPPLDAAPGTVHTLDLVAYDLANNRTEQHLTIVPTGPTGPTGPARPPRPDRGPADRGPAYRAE